MRTRALQWGELIAVIAAAIALVIVAIGLAFQPRRKLPELGQLRESLVPHYRIIQSDTLSHGLVIETIEDLVWHRVTLYVIWKGDTLRTLHLEEHR